MAETILFSNVDKIMGTLASHAIQEIFLAWGLEDDLRRLKATMSNIKAVILDAEEKQTANHLITLWLKQLKHVLYDVEDVFDDFEYQLLRKKIVKTNGGFIRKVRHFFSSSNRIAYRLRIGHQIKDLRLKLDEIAANKAQFHLADRLDAGHVQLRERELTHSFINSSYIIGREGDKETIVEFLLDFRLGYADNDIVSVIPIIGMGGLGKTTLAKIVFNDPKVDEHFDSKLWVCLGDMKEFNVNQVMAKIAKELGVKPVVDLSPQELQKAIREHLLGKMFLLVVDDVWVVNRDSWLELKSVLANGRQGSKIVVTTRNTSVASCVCTVVPHNLQGLPHKDCVYLFKKLAFSHEDEIDEKKKKIVEDIVKKCKGVPLAVRCLGSLLFSKSDENEWLSVRDSRMWQIEESQKNILPVLKFSYDHLPSHLKQCFVYCSIFPEDHHFQCVYLISFWMSHGLLQSSKKNQKPEDVGMQYIKELLSRGFFQDFQEFVTGGKFEMHDLMRDLACLLGQEEFAIESDDNEDIVETVRHVRFDRLEFLRNSGNGIRTVFTRSSYVLAKSCISKLRYLRFLHLSGSSFEELPNTIGTLKHLRYLDLSQCGSLRKLPDSICELHNLQTLNTWCCLSLEKLPGGIGELINLRDFQLTTTLERYSPRTNGIGRLRSLQCLSVSLCPNLQILFERTENVPPSLRMLIVSDCSSLESLFSSSCSATLTTLEVLYIGECTKLNLNYDDMSPQLHLPRLRSLSLLYLPQLMDLPKWIQGCAATLESLEIDGCENLKALPEWLPNFTSLHTLKISDSPLLSSLPQGMERLTALKQLQISACDQLTRRCEKEIGQDWPKIAHVPNINLK